MKSRKIIFATVLSALGSFALCPIVQAVTDTPDPGSVPPTNTADGDSALAGVSGFYNSAFGFIALLSNGAANFNTGVGAGALVTNTASENTAVGAAALISNGTGDNNTATGAFALFLNTDGSDNNAVGDRALFNNLTGDFNNAVGHEALLSNTEGSQNNVMGDLAMFDNTTGEKNTAIGDDALFSLVDGSSNVAIGDEAGSGCVGCNQGIYIGAGVGPVADSELRFIRIGDTSFTDYDFFAAGIQNRNVNSAGNPHFVFVDDDGKVGTNVVDANGKSVPFAPQAMLDQSVKQQKRIGELEEMVARQQKGMEVLTAQLKEQAAQIQKVSAQLEVIKPSPQVVANKP